MERVFSCVARAPELRSLIKAIDVEAIPDRSMAPAFRQVGRDPGATSDPVGRQGDFSTNRKSRLEFAVSDAELSPADRQVALESQGRRAVPPAG